MATCDTPDIMSTLYSVNSNQLYLICKYSLYRRHEYIFFFKELIAVS